MPDEPPRSPTGIVKQLHDWVVSTEERMDKLSEEVSALKERVRHLESKMAHAPVFPPSRPRRDLIDRTPMSLRPRGPVR
jgi:hypothetical protein